MPNWRNKLHIKDRFVTDREPTNEELVQLCDMLIPTLEGIHQTETTAALVDTETLDELQQVIQDFKFVREGVSQNELPYAYGFDDWCEAFNEYMSQLYDIGDTTIAHKQFYNDVKFLWVG